MKYCSCIRLSKSPTPMHILAVIGVIGFSAWSAEPQASLPDRGKLLLDDDLSRATNGSNWQTQHGKWTADRGSLCGSELAAEKHGAAIRRALSFRDAVVELEVKLDGAKMVSLSIDDAIEHVARVTLTPTTFSAKKDDHDHNGPDKAIVFGEHSVNIERGTWHTVTVRIVGEMMRANLDGKYAITGSNKLIAEQKANIGFTVGGQSASFRNLRVWEAPLAVDQTSAHAPATIQTDANQPRIEVIKDQGPNATEWALTPLAEPIPGDIRQNLTYLREDLLDESKKRPKAAAEAYTLASDYCDKILNALDQRDLARVNAGFTAAQADAGVRVTSQALEARRNYMMSWPQYAREKDQRNEILRQQTSGADVKKERIKVEWATRAVQMRSYLDGLYTKLRSAMRQ